jgi:hypothetical protein
LRLNHAQVGKADDALVLVLLAALAAGVVAQGGYYQPGRALVTVLVAVALAAALRIRPWTRDDAWPVPAACAGLGAWALARAAATGDYQVALGAVATLGSLAAVLLVLRRTTPAQRQQCADAAIGVGVAVAATAWIGVAWRVPRFAVLVENKLWRGASTLTYPNAAAALLVPLALVAIALLVTQPPAPLRGAGPAAPPRGAGRPAPLRAAAAYLLLVGVGAALSRAGLIALLVGLVVLAVLAGVRATVLRVAPLMLGAAIAVGALAPSWPATAAPRPGLAAAGLLAGAAVAVGSALFPARARAAALAATLIAAGFVVWAQLGSGQLRTVLASRVTLESAGRSEGARAALELVAQHPLAGTGMGRARFFWTTPNRNGAVALYAHDEYLQTLVDLGAIGLALLLALFAALAVTVRRGRGYPHRPGIRAGAVAALAALAVHSGFDFLWHIAVLPLVAGLLVGLAGPAVQEEPIGPTEEEMQ